MAYHHSAPAAMPASAQPGQEVTRAQRVRQVQYIEERLRNGISPAAIAGITALLAQLETQSALPSLAVSIVADVAGYKRAMTCKNGTWDGYDLTHSFLDDRSSVVRGPSVLTAIEQEATLRIPIANVPMPQPLPPAHMVIRPQAPPMPTTNQPAYVTNVHQAAPPAAHMAPYASAPAANAPHMIYSTTPQLEPEGSSSLSSLRVQSAQSSAPPSARSSVNMPDMSHRTPSEQAVIQALQAVANYPESREFVETISRQLPGLNNLLGVQTQPEGCLATQGDPGLGTSTNTQGPSSERPRATSPIPGLSPVSDEETGRKRASPHPQSQVQSASDSPTSRPPPDKRNNVLRSVVIREPEKVGYHGVPTPQMAMSEVMERYAPSLSSESAERSTPSTTSSATRSSKPPPAPYFPQADNVAGTVVTRDAMRIWQVAPRLDDRQFRDRQRVPPSSADQAQLRKLSVIAHLSRTLRAHDVDIGEPAWEQRVVQHLSTAHDNYLRPMLNNLHQQCEARYSLQEGETWETHRQYPRSLQAIRPISKNAIQRTRYCVMLDSTVPCDLPFDNVVPDVLVVTMPLSRLPEMAEVAIAMFAPELEGTHKEPPPKRIIFANLMDHMACEGQLRDLPRLLREMANRDAARNEIARLLHQIATAMERTAEKLRTHLGVPALFVSPPGMLCWRGAFQEFVYMLSEVCSARGIEFFICAPNLRVGNADLRLAALSAHAYLAAISRLLQPVERGGNAQLTWDDAIFYDHGMRLGTLTFDEGGNRIQPEATLQERENMRRYNWIVREAHPTTVKADLAAVWDQIGRWPLSRETERTIPQMQFADNTEIIKMPLGVRHLVAQEAVHLEALVQAREATYGDWYQDRMATVTLEMAARGLSTSFPALLTSFGLG